MRTGDVRSGTDAPRSPVGLWLLASLLVIGGIAAGLSVSAERSAAADRDATVADLAVANLAAAVQKTTGALRGADGLVVDGSLSAPEFAGFAKDVLADSLFSTLSYAQIVRDEALELFESQTGIDVRDADGAGGFVDAARRPEHIVVRYVYPQTDTSKVLFGFDLASDPQRAGAVAASAASEDPALTLLSNLAGSDRPGLFGTQAVHASDNSVIGYISSGVNLDEVVAAATPGQPANRDVSVYLDGMLVGGSGADGAERSFAIGGVSFVVVGNDPDDMGLALPILIVVATLLLALGVALTAQRDRRLRQQREQVTERNRALAELGQRLAAAVSAEDIVDELLASAAPILGATGITVGRRTDVEPDVVVVRHRPAGGDVAGPTGLVRVDADDPLARCIRDIAPVRVDASPEGGSPVSVEPALFMPLRFHSGYCVGAIGLEWSGARARVLDDLMSAAATVAELAARAIERAVITQVVQDGAARLSGLARSLASAATSTDVAAVVETMVPAIVGSAYASLAGSSPGTGNGAVPVGAADGERAIAMGVAPSERIDQLVRDGTGTEIATIELGWSARVARTPTLHAVLETIAELVGLTLARTGLYDQEHELINELQTALLPPTPDVEGLEIVVRYEPASRAVGIGGDWYDVQNTADGRCFAVIGDVSGHGATAVTTMAQLKAVIGHLLAVDTSAADVYEHADAMLVQQGSQATAQIVQLDVERGVLRVSSAGHPDALVRRADGTVAPLVASHRPLLGVKWHAAADGSPPVEQPFARGDLLLMFTDGLIERRRTSIDVQMARLAAALAGIGPGDDLSAAVDALIATALLPSDDDAPTDDDRAVIAIRRR